MKLQEQTNRIKQIMNIQEQIPDNRFAGKGAPSNMEQLKNKAVTLPTIGLDDTIDYMSLALDGIPGLGNVASATIDVTHALSYIIRFFYAKDENEKIEYAAMGILTLGMAFVPVAGNSVNLVARQGLKQVLKKTPAEILEIAKKAGLYNGAVSFFRKERWKYQLLLLLARVAKKELNDLFVYIIQKINDFLKIIKGYSFLKDIYNPLNAMLRLVVELKSDANLAVSLVKLGQI